MNRDRACAALAERGICWDLLVIGGGATGLGVALDAQTRGLRTLLLEQADFASATSSRSTKLIHGGVRYLPQGHLGLVRQALRERALLLRNAPDLVRPQSFLVPSTSRWETHVHRAGMLLYGLLERLAIRGEEAGDSSQHRDQPPIRPLPSARRVGVEELTRRLPNLTTRRFAGAVRYFDAQFDDAGLALRLAQVLVAQGGTALNYARVERLVRGAERITGAVVHELESGREYEVNASCVVNASGVFCDLIRRMDEPSCLPLLAMSRGSHIVIDAEFLTGEAGAFGGTTGPGSSDALLVPKTADGRVLFAIPWLGRVVVGTTDIEVDDVVPDPHPSTAEIEFLLQQLGPYLRHAPQRSDIRSAFAGLRPLLRVPRGHVATKHLPREHAIEISPSGLVTIAGGKWTTYRLMAEQTVDRVMAVAGFEPRLCLTATLSLLADSSVPPAAQVDERMVRYAVRHQMARTVADVLARRSRSLILDVQGSLDLSVEVARWMADELGRDEEWIDAQIKAFRSTAASCLPPR